MQPNDFDCAIAKKFVAKRLTTKTKWFTCLYRFRRVYLPCVIKIADDQITFQVGVGVIPVSNLTISPTEAKWASVINCRPNP